MKSGTARAALALALLPCVLFADAVSGRVVFYERDILAYWVPAIERFVAAVAEGAWPLWDPLTNFGRPMLADPSFQVGYPPTWLNLVMPPGAYYTLFVVAHVAWAGIGALRLARAWGIGLAGSAWAGAVWMLCGPFLSFVSLYHHFAGAAWIAWVLLALERVLARPCARASGWLAAGAAGMALAGSADVCVMTAAAAAARLAVALAARDERERLAPARLAVCLAASVVAAALAAAVQWWPTLAYVSAGSRGLVGASANMYWSTHPANLLDAIVPGLVAGTPLGTEWRGAVFEGRGPLLRSLYVGLPALALAGLGLAGRWRRRWLTVGLLAGFVLAALGRFTPFYPMLAELPIVRLLRYPAKMLVPAGLFLALLSGAGVDALLGEWSGRRRRYLVAVGIAVALIGAAAVVASIAAPSLAAALAHGLAPDASGVAIRMRSLFARVAGLAALATAALAIRAAGADRPRLLAGALALALVDLLVAARGAVRLAPAALLLARPRLLAALPDPSARRVYSFEYGLALLNAEFTRIPPGWDPEWAWALGHTDWLSSPIATRWGVSGSFDGDFTGLTPVAMSRLLALVNGVRSDDAGLRLLQMASVTDVVSFEESFAGSPPRAEALSVFARPVRLFAVPDPLPRAYVVAGVRADGAPGEASVVTSPDFDARREVALDPRSGRAASPAQDDAGRAAVVARRSDRLTIAVSALRPAVLVVTESYDPGWRAWVDGAPAPVWRANAIFRGVPVPQGDHRVEMRYRPPSAAWGAAASALGVTLIAVLSGRRAA